MVGSGSRFRVLEGVLEELLDEIDVCHNHAATAVSLASKCVHRITASLSVCGARKVYP